METRKPFKFYYKAKFKAMTYKSDSLKTMLFKCWKIKVKQSCYRYMLSSKKINKGDE